MGKQKDQKSLNYAGTMIIAPEVLKSIIEEIAQIPTKKEKTKPMSQENFDADIIVIGAGPGGYVCAIRAAQLGAKVICVEKEYLGGTCLNWGCIPSKALLASAERLHQVKHADQLGVIVQGDVHIDTDKMLERKDKVVTTLRGGIGMLFKKNGVTSVQGTASFVDPHTIEIKTSDGNVRTLKGKNFVLAMGSSPIYINVPGLKGQREQNVWTSNDAVSPPMIPKSMVILGGGAVGCEFGYFYNGLGTEVTIVELMPNLLPMFDQDLGIELGKLLTRQGMKIKTGSTLEKCQKTEKGWKCTIKKGDQSEEVETEVVLLGVGRQANTEGMNLEKIGLKLHKKGIEIVDDTLKTHVPHIYAIGDITGRIQLAHVGSAEGILVATNIVKGTQKEMDYKAIPSCVYTSPEVSSVGLSESQALEKGYEVNIGKFAFRPLGKAMATGEQDGFVKVVCDKKYGEVLGIHMIGAHVTDMIHEGVVALKLEATLDYMIDSIHAHPTMSEAVLEAFEDAAGHAIHKL